MAFEEIQIRGKDEQADHCKKVTGPLSGLVVYGGDWNQGADAITQKIAKYAAFLGARRAVNYSIKQRSDGVNLATAQGASSNIYIKNVLNQTEGSLQAMSGLMSWHGRNNPNNMVLGLPYLETLTSTLALTAGIANLVAQLRGNSQNTVEIYPERAALLAMGQYLAMDLAGLKAPEKPISHSDSPPFKSKDGTLFEIEILDPNKWLEFWQRLNVPISDISTSWLPYVQRYVNASAWLPAALFQHTKQIPFFQLQSIANDVGISLCALQLSDSNIRNAGIMPWLLDGPWRSRILTHAHIPTRALACETELPLQGMTIVESTRLIQGPLATRILGMLGAKIIKIEPINGDPMRGMPPLVNGVSAHFHSLNQGKEIVELDLNSSQGKSDLDDLIRSADVFFHNWGPERAKRLQLTATYLNRVAPNLIYASASGSGNPPTDGAPIGTDFMMQAYSGVAGQINRAGKTGGTLITMVDTLGGACAANAIVAALFKRFNNGAISEIDSSMLGAASLLLSPTTAPSTQSGRNVHEINKKLNLPNVFSTKDGELYVEMVSTQTEAESLQTLITEHAIAAFNEQPDTMLETQTTDYWEELFIQRRITVSRVTRNAHEVLSHPAMQHHASITGNDLTLFTPWTYTTEEKSM